jgi:hypothetical protein
LGEAHVRFDHHSLAAFDKAPKAADLFNRRPRGGGGGAFGHGNVRDAFSQRDGRPKKATGKGKQGRPRGQADNPLHLPLQKSSSVHIVSGKNRMAGDVDGGTFIESAWMTNRKAHGNLINRNLDISRCYQVKTILRFCLYFLSRIPDSRQARNRMFFPVDLRKIGSGCHQKCLLDSAPR